MTAAAAVVPGSAEHVAGLFGVTSADPSTVDSAARRIASAGFDRWSEQVAGCGHCARPVRLIGTLTRHDSAGGRTSVYDTRSEPDRVLLVRCGNRRAAVCPSCSREYAGDMWHLLRAGIAGGSYGVPEQVAARPLVFVTLTAPSFGPVHHTGGPCRPRRSGSRSVCPHGRPAWCAAVHGDDDPRVGSPLCACCYDYEAAVWFNAYASSELWRRFATYLPRALAAGLGLSERQLRSAVRVQYAKVAEFQRRGAIHFHAVLRLDGPALGGDGPFPPPGLLVPIVVLEEAVRAAAGHVAYAVPAWRKDRPGLRLRFGAQVDVAPIRTGSAHGLDEGVVTPEKVAGYIAKYATKAAEDFGLDARLTTPTDLDRRPVPVTAHVRRLVETVHELAAVEPRLGRWLHMLGFPGHFATKSRAFSTTLGALRERRRVVARARARGPHGPVEELLDDPAGEETTLVVGSWRFAGLGYTTTGDAELAAAAAARARGRREEARAARRARTA